MLRWRRPSIAPAEVKPVKRSGSSAGARLNAESANFHGTVKYTDG